MRVASQPCGGGYDEGAGVDEPSSVRDDGEGKDAVAAGPEVLFAGIVFFVEVDCGEVDGDDDAAADSGGRVEVEGKDEGGVGYEDWG